MSDSGAKSNRRQPRSSETSRSRSRARRQESVRRSRSRSGREEDQRCLRRSRSRTAPRDLRPSRHRSRSYSSIRTLREQELMLSREKERLQALEREVRRKLDKVLDRERNHTPKAGSSYHKEDCVHNSRQHSHSLSTPTKRRTPSVIDDSTNPKQPKLTLELFEDFLNILKSKAGDRESFATMNNVIPEFDPLSKEQTINVWLDKVDECTEIYNWTDRQTVHYALPKLSGIAKTWYQGLPSIKYNWSEWKVMLRESFPATENYAELLAEMLDRRVRPSESFELYYFSKINLLNKCKIFGKQAVDCLLHGIDDRGVRVGAQAAKFDKPEDVLEFFKTIKHHVIQNDTNKDFNRGKRSNISTLANGSSTGNSDTNLVKYDNNSGSVTCFNCKGVGHPSFRCPKPLVKCSNCNYLGHESSHCPRSREQRNPPKGKNILDDTNNENVKTL